MGNYWTLRFVHCLRKAILGGVVVSCLLAMSILPVAMPLPFLSVSGLVLDAATGKPLEGVVVVVGDSTWTIDTANAFLRSMGANSTGGGNYIKEGGSGKRHEVSVSDANGAYVIEGRGHDVPVRLLKPGFHPLRLRYPRDFRMPADRLPSGCCAPANTSHLVPIKRVHRP